MATYSVPLARSFNKVIINRNSIIITFLLLILLLLVIMLTYLFHEESSPSGKTVLTGYEHCPPLKVGKTNIHILAHTHDDVAWLKTFDQYYFGTNSHRDVAGVQYILDSVIDQLLQDENRRFVYVEIAFFWRWWKEQTAERQSHVRNLVDRGQLEFAGGAWSMNDEATTSYGSIIDNFTWGFRKLLDMFGDKMMARAKVGWQIDPFGHSREQASIFAHLGFDGVFLNRIDYQDKAVRMKSKNAEFIWKASPNLGNSSDIFATVLYNHYSPPEGLHFGFNRENDAIVDEISNPEYNIDRKVHDVLNEAHLRSELYNTSNIYITWGDDFTYQNAIVWFKNIDKIIKNINLNSDKFNIFYSTPSCYIKSVNDDNNLTLSTKDDDFFPYVQSGYSYWTGYYTSRPTLKYYVRQAANFLQVCKQLMVMANLNEDSNNYALDDLRSTIGLMQHHDAMTGTSKEHVVNDYKLRLTKSIENCGVNTDYAIKKLLSNKYDSGNNVPEDSFKFTSCLRTNITECSVSESGQPFIVTLYNPLSRPVTHYVRLPVRGDGLVSYKVLNSQSEQEAVQLVPVPAPVKNLPGRKSNSTYEMIFKAENIPPFGLRSYYVAPSNDLEKVYASREMPLADFYTIGDINKTALTVDGRNNEIKNAFFNGKMYSLLQSYSYYANKELRSDRGKPSGAYIFNPNDNEPIPILSYKSDVKVFTGVHVDEIHQKFNDWISQVIRIYKDDFHVEFEWLVGPLNVLKDTVGKEVIIRYKMPQLNSNESFFTDCNGREMIKRIRNKRNTWSVTMGNSTTSGNYYPVTSRIMIRDGEKQMSVIPDRPEGGTSIHDGEIELMVHRESFFDDGLGVDEPLIESEYNEGIRVRGKHYLTIGDVNKQNANDRLIIERKLNPVWMFLTQINDISYSTWNEIFRTEKLGLNTSLPDNVRILTLEPWSEGKFLLRLEHIMEKSDHEVLSKIAIVNIQELFVPFTITSIKEMTLGANTELRNKKNLIWSTNEKSPSKNEPNNDETANLNEQEIDLQKIVLYPMQIRTFIINVTFT